MSGNKPPLKREVARSAGGIVSMSVQGIPIHCRGEHRSPGIPGNTSTGKPCSPLQRRWEIMQDNPDLCSSRSIHLSTRHTLRAPFQGRLIYCPPLEKGDVPKGQGDIKTLSNGNARDYPVRCHIFPRHPLTFPENLVESPGAEGNPT